MMESAPAVSVLVPSYNRARYLHEAIASVLAQTYADFEVVLVDDASSDPDVDAVARAIDDPRVRYIRNEKQLGVAGNMRKLLSLARGRYLAILCDDDAWQPEFLSTTVPLLEADLTVTLVFSDYHIIDGEGRIDPRASDEITHYWGRDRLAPGRHASIAEQAVVNRSAQLAMAAVFRRSAVDVAAIQLEAGPAYDLHLAHQLARSGGACVYLAERLTRYRIHSGALTAQRDLKWLRGAIAVDDVLLADEGLLPWRARLRRRQAGNYVNVGMTLLRRGENAEARRYLLTAVMTERSGLVKGIAGLAISLLPRALRGRIFTTYDDDRRRKTEAAGAAVPSAA